MAGRRNSGKAYNWNHGSFYTVSNTGTNRLEGKTAYDVVKEAAKLYKINLKADGLEEKMGKGWDEKKAQLKSFLNELFKPIQSKNPITMSARTENGKDILEFSVPPTQDKNLQACIERKKKDAAGRDFLLESLGDGKYLLKNMITPLGNIISSSTMEEGDTSNVSEFLSNLKREEQKAAEGHLSEERDGVSGAEIGSSIGKRGIEFMGAADSSHLWEFKSTEFAIYEYGQLESLIETVGSPEYACYKLEDCEAKIIFTNYDPPLPSLLPRPSFPEAEQKAKELGCEFFINSYGYGILRIPFKGKKLLSETISGEGLARLFRGKCDWDCIDYINFSQQFAESEYKHTAELPRFVDSLLRIGSIYQTSIVGSRLETGGEIYIEYKGASMIESEEIHEMLKIIAGKVGCTVEPCYMSHEVVSTHRNEKDKTGYTDAFSFIFPFAEKKVQDEAKGPLSGNGIMAILKNSGDFHVTGLDHEFKKFKFKPTAKQMEKFVKYALEEISPREINEIMESDNSSGRLEFESAKELSRAEYMRIESKIREKAHEMDCKIEGDFVIDTFILIIPVHEEQKHDQKIDDPW